MLRSYEVVAYLYAFSYLFQLTIVGSVGGVDFTPYLLSPLLLLVKGAFVKGSINVTGRNFRTSSIILLTFVIVQSIIAGFLFSGDILVYVEHGMEAALIHGKQPYHFSLKVVIQWVYLMLNLSALCSLVRHKWLLKENFASNIVKASVFFVVGIGLWKYIADNFFGWFPYDFFFNTKIYSLQNVLQSISEKYRFQSIFAEASVCGLFLAIFFWNSLFMEIKKKYVILTMILLSIILSLASTAFFAMGFGMLFFIVVRKDYGTLIKILVIGGMFFLLLSAIGFDDAFFNMTVYKTSSQSSITRSAIMWACIDVFKETLLFGLGLGSTCAAGLLATLLGHLGLVGSFLFAFWLRSIYRILLENRTFVMVIPTAVLLFGMCTSVGYLSYPILWLQLVVALTANPINKWCAI